MKETADRFTEHLKVVLGEGLKSVVLYGSMARGEHMKKHSDINILIIVKDVNLNTLSSISKIKNKPAYRNVAPLVFTEEYLENSADVFPIEFLDIKENHIVLYGSDCLKDLKIDLINLRHQCEWELKSKLLQLEKFYIESKGNKKALKLFLVKKLPSFVVVFKNLLRLNGAGLNFDDNILNKLRLARQAGIDIDDLFGKFFSELKRVSDAVDKLPVKNNV